MRLGAHNKSEWPIKQLLKPSFTPGWRLKKRLSLFWTRKYKTVQCQEHRSISFSCGHCWKDHTKSSFGKTSRLWAVSRTRDACVASNICSSQGISQKDVSMSRLHALITIHYFYLKHLQFTRNFTERRVNEPPACSHYNTLFFKVKCMPSNCVSIHNTGWKRGDARCAPHATIFFCLTLVLETDICDMRANFDNNVQPLRFLLLTAPCFCSHLNHWKCNARKNLLLHVE